MRLSKVILGLASVAMLASCGAKDITKAEAIKMAQGYDASNQVYKSGHVKTVTVVTYSDNVPEAMRTQKDGTTEQDITDPAQIKECRVSASTIESLDESITKFKADGNKLEGYAHQEQTQAGSTLIMDGFFKTDEVGYYLEQKQVIDTSMLVSQGETYKVVVTATLTFTWTK